jgi:hypothetical protein
VRSGEVIDAFPFVEPLLQIHVALVGEQLVELLLIRSVRAFDLAVQLRRATLDVGMADAFVFDVPVELRLELVAIICPDFANAKRKRFDDVVDEVDGAGLSVFLIDLECPPSVASSIAVNWKRRIFSPCFPLKVRNLTSIWM